MREQKSKARYGDGCIYPRGNVLWIKWREVRRAPDGTTTRVQHFESTHSDDWKYAQRVLRGKLQAQGGKRPLAVNPGKVSYEDLRENYLARCVEKKLRSLRRDKDDKWTLPTMPRLDRFFGGWKATDITRMDIQRFRKEGIDEGLSDVRMNRYTAILRAMLNQARKDEMITRAEMPAYFPFVKERNEGRGAIFVEPEWYEPLRKQLPEPLRSAFTVAYHCGIRVHELRRLRWRDVDIKGRTAALPGEITKTGKARLVFLPKDFDLEPGEPNDLVFPLGDARVPWRTACIKIGAGRYECKECGAICEDRVCPTHGKRQEKGMRYRGLLLRHTRHTFVRNASDAGLPEARIMAISGHATRSVFDRYNIGREKDVEETRRTMEAFHSAAQGRKA